MSDNDDNKLKDRKKELEDELKSIRQTLDNDMHQVKEDVTSKLDPIDYVRRHPLPMVGLSIFVGFLAGKEEGEDHATHEDHESSSEKLTSTMWYEVKRLAARRVLSMMGNYLEEIF